MSIVYTYRSGSEIPDIPLAWRDYNDTLIDMSTGYTFTVRLVDSTGTTALTKTSGITGAATAPTILIQWAAGELALTAGDYQLQLTARRTSDSKDRDYDPDDPPIVRIKPASS